MVMLLVVHLIIGHRRLRDLDYYRDDELVKRVLGLKRLPDVSTVSRSLSSADERSVGNVRAESTTVVRERLVVEGLASVTLDFDGSVLSTGRHAEGTAVGFNKTKKGARSYYPLFCTVAQTDQVLDVHHRPGNVHDSNGADAFIERCVRTVRGSLPHCSQDMVHCCCAPWPPTLLTYMYEVSMFLALAQDAHRQPTPQSTPHAARDRGTLFWTTTDYRHRIAGATTSPTGDRSPTRTAGHTTPNRGRRQTQVGRKGTGHGTMRAHGSPEARNEVMTSLEAFADEHPQCAAELHRVAHGP